MIHNACATQAIINATMNFGNQDSNFELGDIGEVFLFGRFNFKV